VFAGAFLGEYKNSYDPVKAAIHATVAVSIAVEGSALSIVSTASPVWKLPGRMR
jgi:hypothetical protein